MPFRSEKSSPALFSELAVRSFPLSCALAALLPDPVAFATLSLEAVEPYVLEDGDTLHVSADPALVSTSIVYDSSQLIDTDAGFQNFDFSATADANDNLIEITLDSDTTFSTDATDQRLVVVVYADTQNGGDPLPVPIHGVDGTACSSSNCSVSSVVGSSTVYFAAHSDQDGAVGDLVVALNPRKICQVVYAQDPETPAVGCDDDEVDSVTSSDPVVFRLTFTVGYIDETSPEGVYELGSAEETSDELTLSLHAKEPSFSCPSDDGDFYLPGDGQIRLETSFSVSESTGDAPIETLVVVGAKGQDPDTGDSWASANTIVERFDLGSGLQTIDGFTNTTDGTDNAYSLRFSVRDSTGRMAVFATAASGCALDDVRTSEVEGFLKEGGCFIATAAFRDPMALPVVGLRAFRDAVLLRSAPGRWIVSEYYARSPGAAQWLSQHPFFRLPVLSALLAIAPLAGLLLVLSWVGPGALAAVAVSGMLIGLTRRFGAGRRPHGSSR